MQPCIMYVIKIILKHILQYYPELQVCNSEKFELNSEHGFLKIYYYHLLRFLITFLFLLSPHCPRA